MTFKTGVSFLLIALRRVEFNLTIYKLTQNYASLKLVDAEMKSLQTFHLFVHSVLNLVYRFLSENDSVLTNPLFSFYRDRRA